MAQITISNLSFHYDGSEDMIFQDVCVTLDTSWKLGLVGRNGRGETTLLQLLLGKYEYKGEISSMVEFDYFPKGIQDPWETTRDVVKKLYPHQSFWKVEKEINLMEMDIQLLDRPFATLSGGEQTRILIAIMFAQDQHFLLIDEPTNHLDGQGRQAVMNYLSKKKGFILVSHDRGFLDGCIDHVMALNKANIEITHADFSTWWSNKANRDQFEMAENEKLKKDIERLHQGVLRTKKYAEQTESQKIGTHAGDRGYIGHKSAKMMKRAKAIERRMKNAIQEKGKLLKNIETVDELKIHPLRHVKDDLVFLDDLSLRYGDKTICSRINLKICQGDRILLQGRNGSGKSSLLKLILGEDISYNGTMGRASGLVLSYVSQKTDHLYGGLKEHCRQWQIEESLFKAILRKMDFGQLQFEKQMQDCSDGQKKKILIATSLCQKAHLYLWDEPLNYIDLFSRLQLETLLQKYKPTMLLVEHDGMFAKGIATKLVSLE